MRKNGRYTKIMAIVSVFSLGYFESNGANALRNSSQEVLEEKTTGVTMCLIKSAIDKKGADSDPFHELQPVLDAFRVQMLESTGWPLTKFLAPKIHDKYIVDKLADLVGLFWGRVSFEGIDKPNDTYELERLAKQALCSDHNFSFIFHYLLHNLDNLSEEKHPILHQTYANYAKLRALGLSLGYPVESHPSTDTRNSLTSCGYFTSLETKKALAPRLNWLIKQHVAVEKQPLPPFYTTYYLEFFLSIGCVEEALKFTQTLQENEGRLAHIPAPPENAKENMRKFAIECAYNVCELSSTRNPKQSEEKTRVLSFLLKEFSSAFDFSDEERKLFFFTWLLNRRFADFFYTGIYDRHNSSKDILSGSPKGIARNLYHCFYSKDYPKRLQMGQFLKESRLFLENIAHTVFKETSSSLKTKDDVWSDEDRPIQILDILFIVDNPEILPDIYTQVRAEEREKRHDPRKKSGHIKR